MSDPRRSASTHLALLVVQVFFGLWPVAGAAVMRVLTPPALIGIRTVLAAPLLCLGALIATRSLRVSRRDLLALAGLALLGVTANQLLFAEGLLRAGAVNAAILVTSVPATTLLIGLALGRERLNRGRITGVVLALAGALVMLRVERFDLNSSTTQGNLLLLGNSTCYAAYLVLARPVIARVGPFRASAWVFVLGAIEALPFTLPSLLATAWLSLPAWAYGSVLFIILGPTIGSYFLNAYALRRADASLVAVYVCLQPLVGATAAWLVLDQAITARTAAAGVLILSGVIASSRT
jgi:drug/metabolite transporter (DMT)-like permease